MSTDLSDSELSNDQSKSLSSFEADGWTVDYKDVRQTSSKYTVSKDNYKIVVNETDVSQDTYRVALLEDDGTGMAYMGEGFYEESLEEVLERTVETAELLEHYGFVES